jgi:hypothetical protein
MAATIVTAASVDHQNAPFESCHFDAQMKPRFARIFREFQNCDFRIA